MQKNTAGQKIGAQLVSATDGSAFTGSVTVAVTIDAGTQATGSVGSGACTHEGNGYHTYAPAQAETNGALLAFTFTGTGAIPVTVQVFTTGYDKTAANVPANVTQFGGTNATSSGGRPEVNATHAAGTAWNSGAIGAATLAADTITAAKIAADAIGASELAADAVTEIQSGLSTYAGGDTSGVTTLLSRLSATRAGYLDNLSAGAVALEASLQGLITTIGASAAGVATAVWGAVTRTLTAGTNIVLAKGTGVTGFNDLDAAGVRSAVGLASANLDTQLAAIAGYVDTEVAAILSAVNALSIPTAGQNAAALLDLSDGIEVGLTPRQGLRLMAAAMAGKVSGAATTTIVIRNAVADSKDRITATCDADGNRSAITVDLT